jgi:hypothetical protein
LLCSHCVQSGWLLRKPGTRALEVTPRGAVALRDWLGVEAWTKLAANARA